nr:hypothetical protein [Xanthomonas campestris]
MFDYWKSHRKPFLAGGVSKSTTIDFGCVPTAASALAYMPASALAYPRACTVHGTPVQTSVEPLTKTLA